MYQAHFGLSKGLFDSGIARESAVFLGPKQQLAVANCKVALTTFDSAVVLIGPAGVGKTTLAATALRESSTRLALGWLTGGPTNASELLEMLLAEFGLNATRTGRVERLQMWRQFLNETNATDSRAFVIVESAEDLVPELLRTLESLTKADANGCRGANVVLLGQPGLTEHLQAPSLESLRQRIRLRQKLEPLTVEELRDYLAQHVAQAGGTFDRIFAPDAVAALHQHSGGIPRVVNNLCETALTLAATRRERQLTAELVKRIAVGMFGLEAAAPSVGATTPSAATPPSVASPPSSVASPPSTVASPPPTVAPPAPSVAPAAASVARPTSSASPPPSTSSAPPASVAAPAPIAAPPPQNVSPPRAATPAAPATPPPAAPAAPPAAAAHPIPTTPRAAAPSPTPTGAAAKTEQVALATPATPAPAPASTARPAAPPAKTQPAPASAAPPRTAPRPLLMPTAAEARAVEYDGSETDIAEEILGETTVADMPEVAMVEFPVLTDEVEPPQRAAARTEPARAEPAPAKRVATQSTPKPTPPVPPADDEARQTQTARALAAATSIDDISNSMAETLFAEADLDMLSTALASAGWPEDAAEAAPEPPIVTNTAELTGPAKAVDPFDLFDLGPDAPLELIDDASLPPQKPFKKFASNR